MDRNYGMTTNHYFIVILPWIISTIGIYVAWEIGNKRRWIFLVKVGNQTLWIVWIIISENWGFMPMGVAFTVIYLRNHFKWIKETEQN